MVCSKYWLKHKSALVQRSSSVPEIVSELLKWFFRWKSLGYPEGVISNTMLLPNKITISCSYQVRLQVKLVFNCKLFVFFSLTFKPLSEV